MDRTYIDHRSGLIQSITVFEDPDERSTSAERVWSLAKQQGDEETASAAFALYRKARRASSVLIDGTPKHGR